MSAIKFVVGNCQMMPINLNTNFNNLVELMTMTDVLKNGLGKLGFTDINEDISNRFIMEYIREKHFNIEEPVTGYGFFMPIDAIKVTYPISILKLVRIKLIADFIEDDNAIKCVELINTIIKGIENTDIFYFKADD